LKILSTLKDVVFEEEFYYRNLLNSGNVQSDSLCPYDKKPYNSRSAALSQAEKTPGQPGSGKARLLKLLQR
jgi:hypothetical protein